MKQELDFAGGPPERVKRIPQMFVRRKVQDDYYENGKWIKTRGEYIPLILVR